MKVNIAFAVGCVLFTAQLTAQAGYRYSQNVQSWVPYFPSADNTGPYAGNRHVSGTLGGARNSENGNEYIGCFSYGVASYGYCYARLATGEYYACTATTADHINAIRSLNSDSFVEFEISSFDATCQFLMVGTTSFHAPKAP